jgi:hypothetical protein
VHFLQPSPNSFSRAFLFCSTISTIIADTDGRPPYSLLRLKATLFKSSQTSLGKLIPVVLCVRLMSSGFWGALVLGGFGMATIEFTAFDNRQLKRFWQLGYADIVTAQLGKMLL